MTFEQVATPMHDQVDVENQSGPDDEVLPPIPAAEVLRAEFMEAMGIGADDLAHFIAEEPAIIEPILNREIGLSNDLAHRLGNTFGLGEAFWAEMRNKYGSEQVAFNELKDELLQDYETGVKQDSKAPS